MRGSTAPAPKPVYENRVGPSSTTVTAIGATEDVAIAENTLGV
jgi:hypothetical protein